MGAAIGAGRISGQARDRKTLLERWTDVLAVEKAPGRLGLSLLSTTMPQRGK